MVMSLTTMMTTSRPLNSKDALQTSTAGVY